jgi:putative hemolysin
MTAACISHGLGRLAVLTAALSMALAGCAAPAPQAPAPRPVTLANPAAVACVQAGGRLEIERTPAGERGICLLPDGLRCDEWAWFRKEAGACCATGATPSTSGIKACR